ncbi:MAG TPA: M23 family metallopeptidase [Polyangia bacterium]
MRTPSSSRGRLVVCFALVVSVAACRGTPPRATAPAPTRGPTAPPPAAGPQPAPPPASQPVAAAAPASAPAPAVATAAAPAPAAALKRLRVAVNGPLETAVVREVGAELGPRLVQVIARVLVWWVSVPGDLVRGDQMEAIYQERAGEDPIVHAVHYRSQKHGRTFRAYRFTPAGAHWPHHYSPEGDELELRFTHPPLADYEQVTALMRDGRGHKGVDFKTPVGTPIRAPFDARVVRTNWHFKGNGNSLDLQEVGGWGVTALFLHLAEPPSVAVGAQVTRGQVVAKSGNTGHSFAPHLHYQIMHGPKVLDPFAALPTHRRKLEAGDKAPFATEMARLDQLLGGP